MLQQSEEKQKQLEEAKRERAKVKEELWPFLTSNCESAYDGKMLCEIADVTIGQAFQNLMTSVKLRDLPSLMEAVNQMDTDRLEYKLIKMFEDETVTAAKIMIGGMVQVIDGELRLKSKEVKLHDLPAKFIE